MTKRPTIGDSERRVLLALLDVMEAGPPPEAFRFRMEHESDRALIDELKGTFIDEASGGRYRLTLAGLQATGAAIARHRISDFNSLIPLLRECYRDVGPSRNVSTHELAETAQRRGLVLKQSDTRKALSYLLPFLSLGGFTGNSETLEVTSFSLMERVLDLQPIPLDLPPASPEEPALLSAWQFPTALSEGDRTFNTATASLDVAEMHPEVRRTAEKLSAQGNYRHAILDALIALEEAIRLRSGLPDDLVGDDLMNRTFSPGSPLLVLSKHEEEQKGFMFLFKGAVKAIRNRYGHRSKVRPASPVEALEVLGFISMLFRLVDLARRPRRGRPTKT